MGITAGHGSRTRVACLPACLPACYSKLRAHRYSFANRTDLVWQIISSTIAYCHAARSSAAGLYGDGKRWAAFLLAVAAQRETGNLHRTNRPSRSDRQTILSNTHPSIPPSIRSRAQHRRNLDWGGHERGTFRSHEQHQGLLGLAVPPEMPALPDLPGWTAR
ncbi:hypothetical protein F4780DRAFT_437327 [Xylariomycetidae sp. FL0641]|nr:hypothetical protein F4780DRAFT_437327 [Xylariomycetidae sp. FL0641]